MSDPTDPASPPARAVEAAVELAGLPTPPVLMDAERELGQQAGIVTAASAAVSGHAGPAGAQSVLPGVLADVPVAVLVIDQTANAVMYANVAAVELAGNVQLPVDVDSWGAAAGLTDLTGEPLASSTGPLSLVAQGRPLTGEAVRMSPGRSTEKARADADRGQDDQLL